jgi:hypothetical protein
LASFDAVVITSYNPSIETGDAIPVGVGSVTITPFNASIQTETVVVAGVDSVSVTPYNATIQNSTQVSAGTDTVVITSYNTGISAATLISAATDAATITPLNASIYSNNTISATLDTVTITPFNVGVDAGSALFPIESGVATINGQNIGGVKLDAGRIVIGVYNNTGSAIVGGKLCYVSGTQGGYPTISLADADAESTAKGMLVVTGGTIQDGETGTAIVLGLVDGFSGLTTGAVQYVSTTAGGLTETPPYGTGDSVRVAGYALSTTELFFRPDGTWDVVP